MSSITNSNVQYNTPNHSIYEQNADPRRFQLTVSGLKEGKFQMVKSVVYFCKWPDRSCPITLEKILSTIPKLKIELDEVHSVNFTNQFEHKLN